MWQVVTLRQVIFVRRHCQLNRFKQLEIDSFAYNGQFSQFAIVGDAR